MAATVTELGEVRIQLKSGHPGVAVKIIHVTFAAPNDEATILTPSTTGRYPVVMGMSYAEASAHGLVWKSGSTTLLTEEKAANTAERHRIGRPLIIGLEGQALNLQSTTAAVSSMLFYVTEMNIIQMLEL